MIVRLKGCLLEKNPDHVIVDVQGIGYHVWITLNTYESLGELGTETTLHIYHQIRKDGQDLMGFAKIEERDIFKQLIAIAGIGAKTGINILSGAPPADLRQIIQRGDEDALIAIHGVGPKTARRILTELNGKTIEDTSAAAQAVQSLIALGYKHQEAIHAVRAVRGANAVEDIVRAALRG